MEIYRHPALEFRQVQYGFGLVAMSEIDCGEVLTIDRVFKGTPDKCSLLQHLNPTMMNELFPRDGTPASQLGQETILEKISRNCFGKDHQTIWLGHGLALFNHACDNNAAYVMVTVPFAEDHKWNILYSITCAVKKIERGSECYISYGSDIGHETRSQHDITCYCPLPYAERKERKLQKSQSALHYAEKSTLVARLLEEDQKGGSLLEFFKVIE